MSVNFLLDLSNFKHIYGLINLDDLIYWNSQLKNLSFKIKSCLSLIQVLLYNTRNNFPEIKISWIFVPECVCIIYKSSQLVFVLIHEFFNFSSYFFWNWFFIVYIKISHKIIEWPNIKFQLSFVFFIFISMRDDDVIRSFKICRIIFQISIKLANIYVIVYQ